MIGKSYFARQAEALLRLAKSVKDPGLSTRLLAKAADLEEKATDAKTQDTLITPALCGQRATFTE